MWLEATKAQVTAAILETATDVQKGVFELQAAEQVVELQQQVRTLRPHPMIWQSDFCAAGNNTTLDLANECAV